MTAVFEGGAVSFETLASTPLEELARRLGHVGEQYNEALTAVRVAKGRAWTHELSAPSATQLDQSHPVLEQPPTGLVNVHH